MGAEILSTETLDDKADFRDLLESWENLDSISNIGSTKAIKLLNVRAFELKSDVHQVCDHVWKSLVHLDETKSQLSVQQTCEGGFSLPACNF